jgi:hypothetical protein
LAAKKYMGVGDGGASNVRIIEGYHLFSWGRFHDVLSWVKFYSF